jgi:hypothetical protein
LPIDNPDFALPSRVSFSADSGQRAWFKLRANRQAVSGDQVLLKVQKLDPQAKIPTCEHPGEDLAYDLYALADATLTPGVPSKVRTGIAAC